MNIRNEDGAITIYLTIIFLVILALIGTLVDGARIRVAETHVSRVTESATMSTLAGYYNPLKEDYGLFALSYTDKNVLSGEVKNYLNKNLMTELGQVENNEMVYDYLKGIIYNDSFKDVTFMNLFDYRLDDVNVDQLFSLSENVVMRNQITEFMKYRAPIELYSVASDRMVSIQEKIDAVRNIGKTAETLSRKIELDEIGWRLGVLQGELYKTIEYVNMFPNNYHDSKSKYNHLKHSSFKDDFNNYLDEGSDYINALNEEEIDDELNEESNKEVDRSDLDRAFDELNNNIKENKRLNQDVITKVNEISVLIAEFEQEIEKCEKELELEKDSIDTYNKSFYDTFKNDIERYKNVIRTEKNNSGNIEQKIEGNIDYLENLRYEITLINGAIEGYERVNILEDELDEAIDDFSSYTNDIEYNVYQHGDEGRENPEGLEDNRDKVNTDLESFNKDEEKSKKIDDETKKRLPSYKDSDGEYPNKIVTDTSLLVIDENMTDLVTAADYDMGKSGKYDKTDMDSTTNLLDIMSDFGSFVGNSAISIRDELYVNEYIMGMLTNNVPILYRLDPTNLESNEKAYVDTNKDLMNKLKVTDRSAYFENSEIEYIIWGLDSESTNINSTKGTLLALRFTSDLITIHSIESKVSAANSIAQGIATTLAFFTGGSSTAAIPIIREAILAGWAMAEAIVDVNHIMAGGSIPLYKNDSTWITPSLGNIAKQKGEEDPLALSYHDYLRIMLLITSKEKKMDRLQDLIQLNLSIKSNPQFMIKDYYTHLKVNADVSIKYLFMTQSFMPKSKNTEDGKYRIKSIIYQGY